MMFMPAEPEQVVTLGGGLDLGFSTGSGQVGVSGIDSINLGLRAIASADFSKAEGDALPLRAHVNVGYQFDNSSNLVEDYESANDTVDRIERFSLDINRVDFLTFGLGVEGLFDTARRELDHGSLAEPWKEHHELIASQSGDQVVLPDL